MAIALVSAGNAVASKTTGTTISVGLTNDTAIQAGHLYVVFVGFDNLSASTPTVSSISKPAGESASWTRRTASWNTVSSAGGGTRGEMWFIRTTTAWASSQVTATLSGSVDGKFATCILFSGAASTGGYDTDPVGITTTVNPQANQLVVGAAVCEDNADIPDWESFQGGHGTWSTPGQKAFTTGGGAAANISGILQYKICDSTQAGSSQSYNPTLSGDGGQVVYSFQLAPPPKVGSASGSFLFTGSATAPTTDGGGATGAVAWSGSAAGTTPLIAPTFEHWFCGASSATHGYNELHFKAESFDRVLEVQKKTWGQGDESYVTFHTSATIPAGQEYVARHEGLVLAGDAFEYRARQSVSPQTSNWANASPYGPAEPNAVMGSGWLSWLEVFDNGITYDAISGIVTVGGYERYCHGNGKKPDETTNNWFEYRSLHEELDAFYQAETVYLTGTTSLQRPRFCQANLNNKIYVFGPYVSGAYSTAVYSFGGSSWTTAGSPAMPTAQAWVTAVIGTKVYAAGANNTLYVWDTAGASSWSSLTYSGSSAPHWMAAVNGKLYLYCQDGSFKSYDPGTSTWTTGLTAPSSPYLTSNLASNPVGMDSHGRIYLWGGRTANADDHDYSGNLWHYDVADDAWGSDQSFSTGSHGTMTYSAHWNALIVGTARWSDATPNVVIAHSSPRMIRPIEPGAISDGGATGAVSWSTSASGTTQRSGTASAVHAWSGVATSEGLKQGAASGSHAWSATATGSRQPTGAGTSTTTWSGVTAGITSRAGSAIGVSVWGASAAGEAPLRATIGAGGDFSPARGRPQQATASRFFRRG